MEGFTYIDIFATKGSEYLLVLGGLLIFTLFWRFLSRAEALAPGYGDLIPAISHLFRLPAEGIYFHQGHSWAIPEQGGLVRVGIDDFAQKLVGRIEGLELPAVGQKLRQGDRAWSLKVGEKSIDMLSPVEGRIVAVNERLLSRPEELGQDPYGSGWLLKVEVPQLSVNLRNLLSGDLARSWLEGARERLFARMNYSLGAVSQDGGVPVEGIARNLDPQRWDEIVREFFLTS